MSVDQDKLCSWRMEPDIRCKPVINFNSLLGSGPTVYMVISKQYFSSVKTFNQGNRYLSTRQTKQKFCVLNSLYCKECNNEDNKRVEVDEPMTLTHLELF